MTLTFVLMHPLLAFHIAKNKHTLGVVAVGWADWDYVCSCGKRVEI